MMNIIFSVYTQFRIVGIVPENTFPYTHISFSYLNHLPRSANWEKTYSGFNQKNNDVEVIDINCILYVDKILVDTNDEAMKNEHFKEKNKQTKKKWSEQLLLI